MILVPYSKCKAELKKLFGNVEEKKIFIIGDLMAEDISATFDFLEALKGEKLIYSYNFQELEKIRVVYNLNFKILPMEKLLDIDNKGNSRLFILRFNDEEFNRFSREIYITSLRKVEVFCEFEEEAHKYINLFSNKPIELKVYCKEIRRIPSSNIAGIKSVESLIDFEILFPKEDYFTSKFFLGTYLKEMFYPNIKSRVSTKEYFKNIYKNEKKIYGEILKKPAPFFLWNKDVENLFANNGTIEEVIDMLIFEERFNEIPIEIDKIKDLDSVNISAIGEKIKLVIENGEIKSIVASLKSFLNLDLESMPNEVKNVYLPFFYEILGDALVEEDQFIEASSYYLSGFKYIKNQEKVEAMCRKSIYAHMMAREFEEALKIYTNNKSKLTSQIFLLQGSYAAIQISKYKESDALLDKVITPIKIVLRLLSKYNSFEIDEESFTKIDDKEDLKNRKDLILVKNYLYCNYLNDRGRDEVLGKQLNGLANMIDVLPDAKKKLWDIYIILEKGRLCKKEANLSAGIALLSKGLEKHKYTTDSQVKSLLGSLFQLKGEYENSLGRDEIALKTIEEGLDYLTDITSLYDEQNRCLLLYSKLEVLGKLNLGYECPFNELILLIEMKEGIESLKLLKIKACYLKGIFDIRYRDDDKGLKVLDNLWKQYGNSREETIKIILFESAILEKEWFQTREKSKYDEIINRIIFDIHLDSKKYFDECVVDLVYLGNEYLKEENFIKAKEIFEEFVLRFENKEEYFSEKIIIYSELLNISFMDEKYEKVLMYYEKLKDAMEKSNVECREDKYVKILEKSQYFLAISTEKIGKISLAIDHYEEYLNKFLDIATEENLLEVYFRLGSIFRNIDKPLKSIIYFGKYIKFSEKKPLDQLVLEAYKAKGSMEEGSKNPSYIETYYEGFSLFKDILNKDNSGDIIGLFLSLIKEDKLSTDEIDKFVTKLVESGEEKNIFSGLNALEYYASSLIVNKDFRNEIFIRMSIVSIIEKTNFQGFNTGYLKSYIRLFKLFMDYGTKDEMEKIYLKILELPNNIDGLKESMREIKMEYGKELYKIGEYEKSKNMFIDLPESIVKLHFMKEIEKLEEKKNITKYVEKILAFNTDDLDLEEKSFYLIAIMDKTILLEEKKSIIGNSKKKAYTYIKNKKELFKDLDSKESSKEYFDIYIKEIELLKSLGLTNELKSLEDIIKEDFKYSANDKIRDEIFKLTENK